MSRSIATWVVLVLAGLLLLLASAAVWVDRVVLNNEVFVDTSTELIEDDEIRTAVATRAVDELFTSVDVQAELEEQLPDDYQRLSGPAAAALREASYRLVERALEQPRLQRLWALTIDQSHQTLLAVLEGGGDTVSTDEGTVTLDLEVIVLEAADRIGLRDQIADQIPEDVGQIEILRSDELEAAQDGVNVLETLAWVLPLLALAAFALAVWIAGDRRRAVRRVGIVVIVVGAVGLVAVSVGGNYVVDELVVETENEAAAANAWDILTDLLRRSFSWFIGVGVLFLVASWLAGPGRRAMDVRRGLAPAVRQRVWAYAVLAIVTLFLLVTGPVGDFARYLVVLTLAGLGVLWIEAMRAQTLREYPDTSGSELLEETRSRLTSWWATQRAQVARPQSASAPEPGGASITARLGELADLHARGALTDEEYASAKTRVLAGE